MGNKGGMGRNRGEKKWNRDEMQERNGGGIGEEYVRNRGGKGVKEVEYGRNRGEIEVEYERNRGGKWKEWKWNMEVIEYEYREGIEEV